MPSTPGNTLNELIDHRSFELMIRVADLKGIPEHSLTEGLGITHAQLLNERGYVTWDQFATYCERFEKLIGGPDETLEIGQYLAQTQSFAPLLQFGGLFASPKWLYQFVSQWFGPMMTPAMTLVSYKEIEDHILEFVVATPPNRQDSPAILRIIASLLRYGPTIVGIQPSVVTTHITTRCARYTVQMSPSMTILSRAKRIIHNTFYGKNVIQELSAQHQNLLKNFENLRRSEKDFRLLVNNSPDGILIYSPDKILFANPAIVQFLDAESPEQLIGRPLEDFCKFPQAIALWNEPAAQSRNAENLPFLQITGQQVWADANAFQAHFNGEIAYVCITRDITERKKVLARATEMDRMISMGILAAGIGHEIRNPLSYLLANITYTQNAVEELRKKIHESNPHAQPPQHEWILELNEISDAMASALNGTQRIIDITRDLSSFSRSDAHRFEAILIQDVITAALNIARHEIRHRATILLNIAANPVVHTNATKLSQVILNLLVNAAQAIPSGNVDQNQISIQTTTDHKNVCIEITDTGCGIPPDILQHVFSPFFTTKPPGQGTGLGLSISKNIINELGGDLTLKSTPARGTSAMISLPLHPPESTSQSQ